MKYLALIILLAVSCQTTQAPVSTEITSEETQIAKDLIQGAFDDLWGGVDSTKILIYHTEDFIILENGEVWDNDRIKQFMRGQLAQENRPVRKNMMDYISIDKYGESMQIAYNNKAEFYMSDTLAFEAGWLESALAVKTDDGWRLKMMHSTRVGR